jgi:hypothetical protein
MPARGAIVRGPSWLLGQCVQAPYADNMQLVLDSHLGAGSCAGQRPYFCRQTRSLQCDTMLIALVQMGTHQLEGVLVCDGLGPLGHSLGLSPHLQHNQNMYQEQHKA